MTMVFIGNIILNNKYLINNILYGSSITALSILIALNSSSLEDFLLYKIIKNDRSRGKIMRYRSYILIIILIATLTSCKRDSDIMASYTGGKITRAAFNTWIDSRNIPAASIRNNKQQQADLLKKMVMDEITAKLAANDGYDKNDDFIRMSALFERRFMASCYRRYITENLSFSEDVFKVEEIKFIIRNFRTEKGKMVKLTAGDMDKARADSMKIALAAVQELKNGKNLTEVKKKYSGQSTRDEARYIYRGMASDELYNTVNNLKAGEYTETPLVVENRIYIIKLDEKVAVSNNNIDKKIKDRDAASKIREALLRFTWSGFEKKLLDAGDVSLNLDAAVTGKPGAEIFRIGNRSFTKHDLDMILSLISRNRHVPGRALKDTGMKKEIAMQLFNEELLNREAARTGYDKNNGFPARMAMMRTSTLADEYRKNVLMKSMQAEKTKEWEDGILARYDVKIFDSKL